MENTEILKQLNDIFIDVLDNNAVQLKPETTANDLEEWDSITHIQLIVAMEKRFKMKFTSSEIRDWKSVGDMIESIKKRLI